MRHAAHEQVLTHQKFDKLRIFGSNTVLAAKSSNVLATELGVVTATALGNVVKQRRDVKNPGLVPAGRQLRAHGVFVRMLGHEKTTHVAQHHQDVLVHRVDMEQVVLHLPDDLAEHPQVAAQHGGLVHQPHGMRDAFRLHQNLAESVAVDRVTAKAGVHHAAGVVKRAQGFCRQAVDAHRGLEKQKSFQNCMGLLHIQLVAGHFDAAGFFEKSRVDRPQRLRVGVQPLFNIEQQNLIELGHCLGRPVIAAHQRLAGAARQPRAIGRHTGVAEGLCHDSLQIEHQPVFTPVGQHVQAGPNEAEQSLVGLDLPYLKGCRQAVACQLFPGLAQSSGPRHPQHDLQVTQTAGGFFAVGLERVGRVFKLVMALPQLQ